MKRAYHAAVFLALAGCGASRSDHDTKRLEAGASTGEAETLKPRVAQLEEQVAAGQQQIDQLKEALGMAQSQAITDEQKTELEEAKRAIKDARDRGKLVDDLQTKFKKMIDAGHLKVTTRRGRVALQLRNDVLFDTGDADVKPDGKQAISEVAAALRQVGAKRFQVAGHTDNTPITTERKKEFPTNWELSAARAIAVVKLLVGQGVDAGMLSAAGYGPYDPVMSNATPEGQAKNRRIEITLVPHVAELVAAVQNDKNRSDKKKGDGNRTDAGDAM
jgi:chemotaxis protein MotB